MRPDPRFLAAALRPFGAFLALAGLVVGVPMALWLLVGWPLPHGMPGWREVGQALADQSVPDQVLVKALAVLCWLVWAELMACLVAEVVAALGRRRAARVPLAGPLQPMVGVLVAAVLSGSMFWRETRPASPIPLPAAVAVEASGRQLPTEQVQTEPATTPAEVAETPIHSPPQPVSTDYSVRRRDTLWGIAQAQLGDPLRWREIWEANKGRRQPDGRTFSDPDWIYPGWTLDVPGSTAGLATPKTEAPTGPSNAPVAGAPTAPAPESHVTDHSPAPPASISPGDRVPGDSPTPSPPTDAGPTRRRPEEGPPMDGRGKRKAPPVSVELPSGSVVGLSFAVGMATSLAMARLRRRCRHRPVAPAPGVAFSDPGVGEASARLERVTRRHRAPADSPHNDGRKAIIGTVPSTEAGLEEPGLVPLGERDGREVLIDLSQLGGLILQGAGWEDVARALVVTFLARGGPEACQVIIAGSLFDRLLPGVTPFPGLRRAASVEESFTEAEVELVHRARLLEAEESEDFRAHRRDHPDDPLPALLLVTDQVTQRLWSVMDLGRRVGVGGLIVDAEASDRTTLSVDSEGVVRAQGAEGFRHEVDSCKAFSLRTEEAEEFLSLLASSRGDAEGLPRGSQEEEPFEIEEPATSAPIVVRLFGPYRIEVAGEEIRTGLRSKARELLAFLLLHPRGVTGETAAETLWPEAPPGRGNERFRNVLGNLRTRLRAATGQSTLNVVDRIGDLYRVAPDAVDVDLWRFEAALASGRDTSDDALAVTALKRAADAYTGELIEGSYYEWADVPREDLRRRAVDAAARLADLQEHAGNSEGALTALEQAIRIDPYAEELYRRMMRLEAQLGRSDALRRTFRQLEARLSELDLEPDSRTTGLLKTLLAGADGKKASG